MYILLRHVNLGNANAGQMQVGELVQVRNVEHHFAKYMHVRHANLEVAKSGRMEVGVAQLVAELVHAQDVLET